MPVGTRKHGVISVEQSSGRSHFDVQTVPMSTIRLSSFYEQRGKALLHHHHLRSNHRRQNNRGRCLPSPPPRHIPRRKAWCKRNPVLYPSRAGRIRQCGIAFGLMNAARIMRMRLKGHSEMPLKKYPLVSLPDPKE